MFMDCHALKLGIVIADITTVQRTAEALLNRDSNVTSLVVASRSKNTVYVT
jgi:hypothetical protein